MNALEIYKDLDRLRNFIWFFDISFSKNDVEGVSKLSNKTLIVLEKILCSDIRDDIFNFPKDECEYWMLFMARYRKAVEARDNIYLYDCLNVELKELSCKMLEILWKEYMKELKGFIWHENSEALGSRYPDILNKIDLSKGVDDVLGIREYGMRGQVLYLKEDMREYDLYSGYNPNDFVYHVLKRYDFGKYKKIFVWTLGGDFDIGVLFQLCANNKTELEVYVASIEVFGELLHSTIRKGVLLEQQIKYNFEYTIDSFLEDALMENDIYVYIGVYSLSDTDEKKKIEKFLDDKQIDSNIAGENNEEHFIYKQRIEKNG